MTAHTRAARLELIRKHLRAMRESDSPEVHWKDSVAEVEAIAPEGSLVPELVEMLDEFGPYDRFLAVSLLAATRHHDAWPALEREMLDASSRAGDNAAFALAQLGGDAGHDRLLVLLRAQHDPIVRGRVLIALRAYDRLEGALAIRHACVTGATSVIDAAMRIANMTVPLDTIIAWGAQDDASRAIALEVAITRAGMTPSAQLRGPLTPTARAWLERVLEAPPRALAGFERRRIEEWLSTPAAASP